MKNMSTIYEYEYKNGGNEERDRCSEVVKFNRYMHVRYKNRLCSALMQLGA